MWAGYDMEDAMILNKSAVDRGLAHGTLFKTEGLDLKDDKGKAMVSHPHLTSFHRVSVVS